MSSEVDGGEIFTNNERTQHALQKNSKEKDWYFKGRLEKSDVDEYICQNFCSLNHKTNQRRETVSLYHCKSKNRFRCRYQIKIIARHDSDQVEVYDYLDHQHDTYFYGLSADQRAVIDEARRLGGGVTQARRLLIEHGIPVPSASKIGGHIQRSNMQELKSIDPEAYEAKYGSKRSRSRSIATDISDSDSLVKNPRPKVPKMEVAQNGEDCGAIFAGPSEESAPSKTPGSPEDEPRPEGPERRPARKNVHGSTSKGLGWLDKLQRDLLHSELLRSQSEREKLAMEKQKLRLEIDCLKLQRVKLELDVTQIQTTMGLIEDQNESQILQRDSSSIETQYIISEK